MYTAEQREKSVEEVRATGARVVDLAKKMGIAPSAAYVWLKRSSPAASAPSAPVFARVVPAQPPTARRWCLSSERSSCRSKQILILCSAKWSWRWAK